MPYLMHPTGDSDLDQAFVDGVTQYSLPASKGRLEYKEAQNQDSLLSQVRQYCESEWPEKQFTPPVLIPMLGITSVCDDLLLFNGRIVALWAPKMQG